MRSHASQTVLLRVLDQHLHVLQAPQDALFLNWQYFLVSKRPDFLVFESQGGLLVGVSALDCLHVALDE